MSKFVIVLICLVSMAVGESINFYPNDYDKTSTTNNRTFPHFIIGAKCVGVNVGMYSINNGRVGLETSLSALSPKDGMITRLKRYNNFYDESNLEVTSGGSWDMILAVGSKYITGEIGFDLMWCRTNNTTIFSEEEYLQGGYWVGDTYYPHYYAPIGGDDSFSSFGFMLGVQGHIPIKTKSIGVGIGIKVHPSHHYPVDKSTTYTGVWPEEESATFSVLSTKISLGF